MKTKLALGAVAAAIAVFSAKALSRKLRRRPAPK